MDIRDGLTAAQAVNMELKILPKKSHKTFTVSDVTTA